MVETQNAWLLDDVTHHLTNDESNLVHSTTYSGVETVIIGNGSNLSIKSHGSNLIMDYGSSLVLHFSDLLHTHVCLVIKFL